jgi:hypothetical protein
MNAVLDTKIGSNESLSLTPRLQQLHGGCTKRIAELEAIVASLRAALEDAEAALQREMARQPEIGDFVRCPLTNFYGRVTKVTPRPHGRPWVEIIPYLAKDYPGHAPMDLYDSWELIDSPSGSHEIQQPAASSPKLPSVASFNWLQKPDPEQQIADDIEILMSELWQIPDKTRG